MIEEIKIEHILSARGYSIQKNVSLPQLAWRPDLLVRKNGELFAVLIRKSDDIPESFLQRMAITKAKDKKILARILFCKKPKLSGLRMASLYGVGVWYLDGGKLVDEQSKKVAPLPKMNVQKKRGREQRKMPRLDLFISSHQSILERKIAAEVIKDLRDAHNWPLLPILIENDPKYSPKRVKKCIKDGMDRAELFVAILAKEYRPIVKDEIKMAFKTYFKGHQILIFVRDLKDRPILLQRLISWIEQQGTVKYLPYFDESDFKTKLNGALMVKIQSICKKKHYIFI